MNIITNNCVAAAIYQIKKTQFTNPFMWTLMSAQDFIYLVQNFKSIDFSKIKLTTDIYKEKLVYKLIVDGKLNVLYIHHKKDKTKMIPTKIKRDIWYANIENYIIDCWNRRLKRMTETPKFIVVSYGWTYDQIIKFADIKTDYKKGFIIFNEKAYDKLKANYPCICLSIKDNLTSNNLATMFTTKYPNF